MTTPNPLILLVDDFDDAREMYTMYFVSRGRRVVCAADGAEAVERARDHQPDIILLDLRMPGMTGIETLHRLRCDPAIKRMPIVALTAHALDSERDEALQAGFDAVIPKPILPDDLCRVIDDLLSERQTNV